MIPQPFEYLAPTTLSEAIALLQKHGEEAKVLAGGHSLIPAMKLRLATPGCLINIGGIAGLDTIKEEGGFLKIGALTVESALEDSELIQSKYPLIADAVKLIADPSVRNMATVGGNLAHGDPGNDHPAVMLALGATIVITGAQGERSVAINDFFTDFFETALASDEILTEIQIPIPPAGSGGAYLKLERKVGDYAIAAVAAQVTLDGASICQYAGLALTNAGGMPIKVTAAEHLLQGQQIDDTLIQEAAQLAQDASDPAEDLRGSVEYKKAMIKELAKRALVLSIERAKGGQS